MPDTAEFLDFNKQHNVFTCATQFGTPIQNATAGGFTFAIDTAVGQIMTTTVECGANCTYFNTFNMTNSSSLVNMSDPMEVTIPGGYSGKGVIVKDVLCTLPNLICMGDLEFFAIMNGTGTDGNWTYLNIFGLAPTDNFNPPAYVQHLLDRKQITKSSATLFLNVNSTTESYSDKYSIMSFGRDTRDHDAFVKGEWWSHEWEMTQDPKFTNKIATIEIVHIHYGKASIVPDSQKAKVLFSTTTNYLVLFGKGNKAAYDAWTTEVMKQFSDI